MVSLWQPWNKQDTELRASQVWKIQNWCLCTELWQNTVEASDKQALEIYILTFAFLSKPIYISAEAVFFMQVSWDVNSVMFVLI